jgi:hypothetical protein
MSSCNKTANCRVKTEECMIFHDEVIFNKIINSNYGIPFQVFESGILKWAGHVAHMGEMRGAYRILVGKPEERRPLEKPRHMWGITLKWGC